MEENSKFVDQAVPHESGGQVGAAKGDVAPVLRLQFRDLFRHDVVTASPSSYLSVMHFRGPAD